MPENLEENIQKWLNDHGYPFEMQVARTFADAGYKVGLGSIYPDFASDSGSREIDVSAAIYNEYDPKLRLEISLSVECKTSRSQPWVLFVADTHVQPVKVFPFHILFSAALNRLMMNLGFDASEFEQFSLFQPERIGFGITQAMRPPDSKGADVPHLAVQSAAKASIAEILEVEDYNSNRADGFDPLWCTLAVPVVAFDSRLFECSLDTNGSTTLREIPYGVYYWRGLSPLNVGVYVHVVASHYLQKFVEDAKHAVDYAIAFALKHQAELLKYGGKE